MPDASGVDVLAITLLDFQRRRRLINNLAWTIEKEGIVAMSKESLMMVNATKMTKITTTLTSTTFSRTC